MPIFAPLPDTDENNADATDRLACIGASIEIEIDSMNREDAEKLLSLMPNERYRTLIQLRYLEQMTNEETAKELEMTMDNYYNIHKRAKAQFESICRKEEYYG